MKCLVIAAGQGTRLRSIAPSKPMARLAGRPLIEHVIRAAKAGGASEFVVVTGYAPEPLEAFLVELGERIDAPVEAVRNPDWERPNGLSVLAAAEKLDREFVLLMADHLFDPAILTELLASDRSRAALTLAADHDIENPLLDVDDATKLDLDPDGRIRRIGKAVTPYDAVDTGIFVARPPLIEALRISLAAGASGSLSEGVQALADQGLAWTWDIGGRWWLDVDDERAFRRAIERLEGQPLAAST